MGGSGTGGGNSGGGRGAGTRIGARGSFHPSGTAGGRRTLLAPLPPPGAHLPALLQFDLALDLVPAVIAHRVA